MFRVFDKENEIWVDVYRIRDDKNGYPYFLIYEDGVWKYRSAKYFTTEWEEDYWC